MRIFYSLLLFIFVFESYSNFLLQKPELLTDLEIDKLVKDWKTSFSFNWHKSFLELLELKFNYFDGKSGFGIKILKLPIYSYGQRYSDNNKAPEYYFAEPLHFDSVNAKKISQDRIIQIIKEKKIIFYTGAGISASANVDTMSKLMESLELTKGKIHFFKTAWSNPEKINKAFYEFCRSAVYFLPTAAHYSLKNICQFKSAQIVTENVDLLQQRTGIKPVFAYSDELQSLLPEDLQEIDAIICVGLSHDDRGFLGLYKKHNLQGVIISIDLKQPDYLSEKDLFLQSDLQKILPEIESSLFIELN